MSNFFRFSVLFLIISSFLLAGCGKKEAEQQEPVQEAVLQVSEKILNPDMAELGQAGPEKFQVKFETSKGNFIVEVTRDWSPYGADRFYYLVKNGFYDNVRFFRVVAGFMAQFGYHGDPQVTSVWSEMNFPDDPVKESNLRGNVTFAKRGIPNSRSTNIFINLVDNAYLDQMGFSPLGKVVQGMEIVDQLYSGYGDGPPSGSGPEQGRIAQEGNEYLNNFFPNLDYIKKATIL